MPDIYNIFWKTHHVGRLTSGRLEMWHLEGFWSPAQTPEAQQFEELLSSLNAQVAAQHSAPDIHVLLVDIDTQLNLQAQVTSESDGHLFLKLGS